MIQIAAFRRAAFSRLALIVLSACARSGEDSTVSPSAAPNGSPALHDTSIHPADQMVMVFVPQGSYSMGSTERQINLAKTLCQQYPDAYGKYQTETFEQDAPQHRVEMTGFWIDKTEVTNAQYERCVQGGECRKSHLADNPLYNGDDYPVVGIPWQDAMTYCQWAGGRLPTEIEWEYDARGEDGRIYPCGDEFGCGSGNFWDECSPCEVVFLGPSSVGSFPEGASWCGAMDMAENAWEWIGDVYDELTIHYSTQSPAYQNGDLRVLRGGSWGYCPAFVRTDYRYIVSPDADYSAVGLRCVVALENGDGDS